MQSDLEFSAAAAAKLEQQLAEASKGLPDWLQAQSEAQRGSMEAVFNDWAQMQQEAFMQAASSLTQQAQGGSLQAQEMQERYSIEEQWHTGIMEWTLGLQSAIQKSFCGSDIGRMKLENDRLKSHVEELKVAYEAANTATQEGAQQAEVCVGQ